MDNEETIYLFNIDALQKYTLGCVIDIKLERTSERKFAVVLGYYYNDDGYIILETKFIDKINEHQSSNLLVDLTDLSYNVTKIG